MRIRIIKKPQATSVDGLNVSKFIVGQQYDIGHAFGALFLAEGWAEPVDDFEPTLAVPLKKLPSPSNLTREFFPPYYQRPAALAADGRQPRRRGHLGRTR